MAWHYDQILGRSVLWMQEQEDAAMNERRAGIFESGRARAKAGESQNPIYAGRELGSLESMNFWDGYAAGCREVGKSFKHPMRR